VRVLVQSGWSEISQEWFSSTAMDIEIEMSNCSSGRGKHLPEISVTSRLKSDISVASEETKSFDGASLSSGFSKSDGFRGYSATKNASSESNNSMEGNGYF
jgi:hypothetical protein